jgi:hypothetical protein
LQSDIVALGPFLQDRIAELDDWSKIRLLTVQINRLRRWCREGLLCIGDCAHAMSPAGVVPGLFQSDYEAGATTMKMDLS